MFFVKDAAQGSGAMRPAIRAAIGLGEQESPHGRTLINEVARPCDVYDQSSFVKRFRHHTGLTPPAYRKANCTRLTTAAGGGARPRRRR